MLENANFSNSNMANTILFEANLENAILKGTNLEGAIFIEQANLDGAVLSNNTILPSGEKATLSWSARHNAKFINEPEVHRITYDTHPPVELVEKVNNTVLPSIRTSAIPQTASRKQEALISEDVASWNQMRSNNPAGSVTLKEEKLENTHLKGINLQQAVLVGSSFEGASLDNANMAGADLSKANFHKADMKSAQLQSANLQGANLDRAFLKGANLSRTNLTNAVLYGAMLAGANLSEANLEGASLFDADFEGANLEGANLKGANITDTNFKNATLSPLTTLPSGEKATSGWAILKEARFVNKTRQ
jgi:uncharacterized protein YjbI with pentapeptide repeats